MALLRLVHQEDVRMEEKILRHFDLSNQYGVCGTRPLMQLAQEQMNTNS